MTPTLELDEVNVSTFAMFKYEHSSLTTERGFKKKTVSHFLFYKVRQLSELEVKFLLKWYHLEGKERANHPPKGPQTGLAKGGGR